MSACHDRLRFGSAFLVFRAQLRACGLFSHQASEAARAIEGIVRLQQLFS